MTACINRLATAASEGLEPNISRWLRFRGDGWVELLALEVVERGPFTVTRSAFVDSPEQAARLLTIAEGWDAQGLYSIPSGLRPGVETRREPNKWHNLAKAGRAKATTDRDIADRRVFYIDADVDRPAGVTATDAEVAEALEVAETIRADLLRVFPENAIGDGHSGNGGAEFVAIEPTPLSDEFAETIKAILVATKQLYGTPTVKIDVSVSDPKRLVPAFGTAKKKGWGGAEGRPHRRSAFVCADKVERVPAARLNDYLAWLKSQLPPEAAPAPKAKAGSTADSPFTRANSCDIRIVAERCGLIEGGHVKCPGCGTVGDSSVAFTPNANGLKCMHDRCAMKGKDGFRTAVDLVMEVQGCASRDAAATILEWFGLEGFTQARTAERTPGPGPKKTQPASPPSATADQEAKPAAPAASPTPANDTEAWPEIADDKPAELPPFPVNALPPVLAAWVREESESTQTPPDLAASMVLAVLATAAAKRARVRIKADYFEPVNLFTAAILPPGERKSAVVSAAARPLEACEREIAESMRDKIEAVTSQIRFTTERYKSAMRRATKTGTVDDQAEAERLGKELSQMKVPHPPRLVADDVTPERLAGLLLENEGAIGVLSAEGGIFDTIAGRYSSNVPNMDVFLKGHAGDHIRVDRIGRPPEHIAHPALTVGLTIQPSVVADLAAKGAFRGRGLLGRFLYTQPTSRLGSRDVDSAPVTERTSAAYASVIRAIVAIPRVPEGAKGEDAHVLILGPDALVAWKLFYNAIEARLAPKGDLVSFSDWAGKLPGACARIAGLLHLAEHATRPTPWRVPISGETMRGALEIGSYYLKQASGLFGIMARGPGETLTSYVRTTVVGMKVSRVSRRDIWRRVQGKVATVAHLKPILDSLETEGTIREVSERTAARGRPGGPFYDVNPRSQVGG